MKCQAEWSTSWSQDCWERNTSNLRNADDTTLKGVRQTPLSMRFFRQEYWSRLSFPLLGESSWPKDWTHVSYVSCIIVRFFICWAVSNIQVLTQERGLSMRPKMGEIKEMKREFQNYLLHEGAHLATEQSFPYSSLTLQSETQVDSFNTKLMPRAG